MNKKIIVLLSIFFIIACSGAVFAEDIENNDTVLSADDISVDDTVSSIDDVSADDRLQATVNVSGSKFDDIQTAINNAKSGDVIELTGKYTGNKKIIKVSKSLTIQSASGATLDAKHLNQIFEIKANNVVLKGLTFINSQDSALSIPSSEKTYNLKIINCTFSENGGGADGGAIFYANKGTLTVINSTFNSNNADFGGAIYGLGNFNIQGSKFTSNIASYQGGAIHFIGENLQVSSSTFTSNRAKGEDGGAIHTEMSGVNISNSIFDKNLAPEGGALNVLLGRLTVSDCNFTSSSSNEKGGAIYYSGEMGADEKLRSYMTVSNSNFKGSSAKKGNSIYACYVNADIANSTFDSKNYDAYLVIATLNNANNTGLKYNLVNSLNVEFSKNIDKTTYDSYTPLRIWMYGEETHYEFFNYKVKVKITSGSKTKEYTTYTQDEYSYVLIKVSNLPVGKHKVKISFNSKYFKSTSFTTTITIKKAKTTVTAKKVTAKYKKSKKFTVKVKNKATGKVVKNLKIKIKVYTGKKAKSYIVKTNKKGIAKINTKKLKRGNHKVVITSKNKNYSINKKSSIKIK